MDIDKPHRVQPEITKRYSLIKGAGLALLIAALLLLLETTTYGGVAGTAAVMAVAEDSTVTASFDKPQMTEIPVELELTEYDVIESSEPKLQPIDYRLACFNSNDPYTVDLLTKDIEETLQSYSSLVSYDVIGKSVQGKDIYALTVGHGPVYVLITAGVHARENANTPLIMQCLFDFLYAGVSGDEQKAQILNRVTLIVVPLVNPDGYDYCIENQNGRNKTNLSGVDINRNFPCKYWGSRKKTSGNFYPGPYAGSEPETQAVMTLFDQYHFTLAVDIHSRGRDIICQKGGYTAEDISTHENPEELNTISITLARYLLHDIKYELVRELKVKKGEEGTLTDYAFSRGVPTITFETLKYRKNRLANPSEIQKEYGFFDWPNALYKIAEFAVNSAE